MEKGKISCHSKENLGYSMCSFPERNRHSAKQFWIVDQNSEWRYWGKLNKTKQKQNVSEAEESKGGGEWEFRDKGE